MCAMRGYPLEPALQCVVSQHGDRWVVDVDHAAYPRMRKRSEAPQAMPSLVERARNFATSAARHVASGMRTCTEEQVEARYAICRACEFFRDESCMKCGCPLARGVRLVSKLSWANENCPVGKWGPGSQQ